MTTQREIRNVADNSSRVITVAAAITLDMQTHSGRIVYVTGEDRTITLPPAIGSGAHFTIVGGSADQGLTIDADGTDVFKGTCFAVDTDSADNSEGFYAAAQTQISTNGTTSGGEYVGDVWEMVDVAAGIWWVKGRTTCTGTLVTPFAA